VTFFTARYLLSLGNVALSLLLGVVALAMCAVYSEDLLLSLLKSAASVRDWIVSFRGWPKLEIIARLVLHESSILLMFFTIMARVVVGFLIWLYYFLRGAA
jgi:hypothetical protein